MISAKTLSLKVLAFANTFFCVIGNFVPYDIKTLILAVT